jgi:hypothetical protein
MDRQTARWSGDPFLVRWGRYRVPWYSAREWLVVPNNQLLERGLAEDTEVVGENLPQFHFVPHIWHMNWRAAPMLILMCGIDVCRTIPWIATSGSTGETQGSVFWVRSRTWVWASRCWREYGVLIRISTTARILTCTPSRCPTNYWGSHRRVTFCIPCGQ